MRVFFNTLSAVEKSIKKSFEHIKDNKEDLHPR